MALASSRMDAAGRLEVRALQQIAGDLLAVQLRRRPAAELLDAPVGIDDDAVAADDDSLARGIDQLTNLPDVVEAGAVIDVYPLVRCARSGNERTGPGSETQVARRLNASVAVELSWQVIEWPAPRQQRGHGNLSFFTGIPGRS